MGARLQYAKVTDRELFLVRGGKVHPGLENEVLIHEEPGTAGAFLVLRGWTDDHGSFTEQWRIVGPGGGLVYESLPRELHLATRTHVERLEDEVSDLDFAILVRRLPVHLPARRTGGRSHALHRQTGIAAI